MEVCQQIRIVMVILATSILCQLIMFSAPGWLLLHVTPADLSDSDKFITNYESDIKYGVWYIIVCSKGRYDGYNQSYTTEFDRCLTASYQETWNMFEEEGVEAVSVLDQMAGGRNAIIELEVEITLALVSVLVAFSLMTKQSLQISSAESGDITMPPNRNICTAVVVFTTISGCLLLRESVAFIKVNITKTVQENVSYESVSFLYCLALSVLATVLNFVVVLIFVYWTCRRQEETLWRFRCHTCPATCTATCAVTCNEPSSEQTGNSGQQQGLPLMSQPPPQNPNNQPPQT